MPDTKQSMRDTADTPKVEEILSDPKKRAQIEFEAKKLAETQKKNIQKANKLVGNCQKQLIKLGFLLQAQPQPPLLSLRPLDLMEWQAVEKQNFLDQFTPGK